jgi:neutral ceramidase
MSTQSQTPGAKRASLTPASLRAGVAREDITPELGALLMGYPAPERTATALRDRLSVTALVIEQAGRLAALLSLDVIVVDDADVAAIRAGIETRTGIPAENVIVSATQTHSGPCTLEVWGWSEKDQAYTRMLIERCIGATAAAHAQLRPVTIGIGTVQSDIGVNRREIAEDHRVVLGVNPWAAYDPTMTVLRIESASGSLATLIHYGAHPTVLPGSSRVISRDWPGVMIDRVEALTKAPALFVNGAVGDVAPRTNTLGAVGDGETALQEVGTRAAMDAVRAYRAIRDMRDLELAVLGGTFTMPYRSLPPLGEARRELSAAEADKDKPGPGIMNYRHWQAVVAAHAQPAQDGKAYRQTLLQLGPLAFVPFPGEPFAEIVLRLRQRSPYQHTLCLSTSCGNNGYFPTRESLHRGGYEVWVARAFGARIVAENIDDVLVRENLALLRRLCSG